MDPKSPRPVVEGMSPYEPGKPIDEIVRDYDLDEDPVKLASNENPYPPPDSLKETYIDEFARLNRYPDGGSYHLREALSEYYDWPMDGIVIGAGSDEVADFLTRAFLREDEEVVVADPAFIRHRMLTTIMGAKPVGVPLTNDYGMNLKAMREAVGSETRFVFLPNPNNPTSRYVNGDDLRIFLESLPDHVTVVLDEAYREFMDQSDYPDGRDILEEYRTEPLSVILLRTFSKAYGLPGLRVGYALMDPARARELHKVRPPFNVSRPAQAVARDAIGMDEYLEESRRKISEERERLTTELSSRGIDVVPPSANFMLATVPGNFTAETFSEALLEEGLIVRSMAPYGLEDMVRVTVGTPGENDSLLEAVDVVIAE